MESKKARYISPNKKIRISGQKDTYLRAKRYVSLKGLILLGLQSILMYCIEIPDLAIENIKNAK